MSEFKICIPSKGRGGKVLTAKYFQNADIYVPASEIHAYSMYKNVISVPLNIKGITATRNYILKNNKNNVFFIDDDLKYFGYIEREKEKYKVIKLKDGKIVEEEIKKLFNIACQTDSKLIGFFTVGNNLTNYNFNPFLFNGVVLGSCMGVINDGTYFFDETFKVKEDYELSLRNIKDGRMIITTNIIFMQHDHNNMKNGCFDDKRNSKEEHAIKNLIQLYPGMIKKAEHRKTGYAIQLNI